MEIALEYRSRSVKRVFRHLKNDTRSLYRNHNTQHVINFMPLTINRELVTDPLDREDLWADLRANIELFASTGYTRVLAFFGFAWGKHIYADQWYDMPMTLKELEKEIVRAEEKGFGLLGSDNLYFTLTDLPLKLAYSYESDIHLSYALEDDTVTRIRERWLSNGWLMETLKSKHYDR